MAIGCIAWATYKYCSKGCSAKHPPIGGEREEKEGRFKEDQQEDGEEIVDKDEVTTDLALGRSRWLAADYGLAASHRYF